MGFAEEATALRFERDLKSGSGRAFAKRHFGSSIDGPFPLAPYSATSTMPAS